jgi:hypothetical protein
MSVSVKNKTELTYKYIIHWFLKNGSQKRNARSDIFTNRIYLSTSSVHNYVKNLSPEINQILETETNWSFDILELEKLTNKR